MKKFILACEQNSTECLKRLPELENEFFSQTFQTSNHLLKPGYFSFANFADINRIGVLIKRNILILRLENDKLYLVHNFPNEVCRREFLYVVIKKENTSNIWQLVSLNYFLPPNQIVVENSLFSASVNLLSTNFDSDVENDDDEKISSNLQIINQLLATTTTSQDNYPKENDVILLLRFNCCLKKNIRFFSKLFSGKNCYFSLEYVYFDANIYSSQLIAIEEARKKNQLKIVSLFLNDSLLGFIGKNNNNNTIDSSIMIEPIVSNLLHIKNRDKIRSENFSNIPLHVTTEEFLKAREKRNANEKYRPKKFAKICSCNLCASSTAFDQNMNLSGPEQLCKTKWLLRDLLKMVGFDSDSMLNIVEKLSELSVASFDIESRTVNVDMYKCFNDVNLNFDKSLNEAKFERGCAVEAVQKPCMLAHTDKLDDTSQKNKLTFFECKSDSEAEIFDMFKAYWTWLVDRQKLLIAEKTKIAQPILKIVDRLEKEHSDFCTAWSNLYGHEPDLHFHRSQKDGQARSPDDLKTLFFKDANSSFKQTLFGQLKTELQKLIHQLNVFSFYG